jgi:hypothetical protein
LLLIAASLLLSPIEVPDHGTTVHACSEECSSFVPLLRSLAIFEHNASRVGAAIKITVLSSIKTQVREAGKSQAAPPHLTREKTQKNLHTAAHASEDRCLAHLPDEDL